MQEKKRYSFICPALVQSRKTGKRIKRLCKNETSCSGEKQNISIRISMQDLAGYVETSASYILEKENISFYRKFIP